VRRLTGTVTPRALEPRTPSLRPRLRDPRHRLVHLYGAMTSTTLPHADAKTRRRDVTWSTRRRADSDLAIDEDSVYLTTGTANGPHQQERLHATVIAWSRAVVSVEQDASHVYYATWQTEGSAGVQGETASRLCRRAAGPEQRRVGYDHVYWIDEAHNSGMPLIKRVRRPWCARERGQRPEWH